MKPPFLCITTISIIFLNTLNGHPLLFADNAIDEDFGDNDLIDISHLDRSAFGKPDKSSGERLANYNPSTDLQNPEELGNYLEGDILMPTTHLGRNGLAASTSRWPNGVVPFLIQGSFDAFQMNLIEQAFNEYHAKTCIKFVPRTTETDYITLVNGRTGCWSSVGRIGGPQEVNFQTPGCMSKVGTVIHELMHACGFLHEQNRYERDDYVTVNYANIRQGTENNFDKASAATTNAFGVEYDYGSVMHYSGNAFSSNGLPTIIPRFTGPAMGQRNGFSEKDIDKLNRMYNCYVTSPVAPSPAFGSFPYYPIGGFGPVDYYG